MNPSVYALSATVFISLISLVGVFFYRLKKFSFVIVSFAVGALLGDAFIHIIPQSFEILTPNVASLLIFVGLIIFFTVEKVVRWRHCHEPDCHDYESDHIVSLSLVGDSVHNFIDGMIIAASFLSSVHLGLVTTLAVVLHEIPQEIGDFGIYLHHGLTLKKAITINLISAFFALLGCLLIIFFGNITHFSDYVLPATAGGFIYLAASDLIPELHRHQPAFKNSLIQIITVSLGFLLMFLLLFVE